MWSRTLSAAAFVPVIPVIAIAAIAAAVAAIAAAVAATAQSSTARKVFDGAAARSAGARGVGAGVGANLQT